MKEQMISHSKETMREAAELLGIEMGLRNWLTGYRTERGKPTDSKWTQEIHRDLQA